MSCFVLSSRCEEWSSHLECMSSLYRERFHATPVEEGSWSGWEWNSKSSCYVDGEEASRSCLHVLFLLCYIYEWLKCFKHSAQAIPTTCRDTLTYAVTKTRYREQGNDASCGNSTCDVSRDAHRINLRVSREGTLFAEDSVHVPATGESEFNATEFALWWNNGCPDACCVVI